MFVEALCPMSSLRQTSLARVQDSNYVYGYVQHNRQMFCKGLCTD